MAEQGLRGKLILVAEDEYMLAAEITTELMRDGAIVVGPAGSLDQTLALINSAAHLDAAVLDVNLHGDYVFAAADILAERRIPFILATGYDQSAIPSRFDTAYRCEKPAPEGEISRALRMVLGERRSAQTTPAP